MKRLGLAARMFYVWALLDTSLIPVVALALSALAGLQYVPAALIYLGLAGVRLPLYWLLVRRMFRPTEILQQRADRGRMPSPEALLAADALLTAGPQALVRAASVLPMFSCFATIALHVAFVAKSEVRSLHVPIVLMIVVAAAVGPLVLYAPLFARQSAEAAGRNYSLARALGIDLERPERPIASRLVVVSLALCTVPMALVIGASMSFQSVEAYALADMEARALAAELHAATVSGRVDPIASIAGRISDRRTSVALVEGNSIHAAGAELPAWANAELLRGAAEGQAAIPDRSVAVRASRLDDGRVAVVLVQMASVERGFVAVMASVLVMVLVFALLSAWLLALSLSGPLQRVAETMRRAAEEGDLSAIGSLPVEQVDEVGQAAHHLNEMLDGMRKVAAAAAAVGGGDLAVTLESKGELADAFRRMMDQLREVVKEMHDAAAEVASAAAEIFAASQEQEAAATSHAAGMTEVTETMSSLSASATHVASAVRGVLENAEQAQTNTDQMVARINELTGHAGRIGEILEAIREIANRTDLLALNGSLEATRAGDAGVGFSLVASEMRRLAERVTASVAAIKALVADIGASGASTVVATEESRKLADSTTQAARRITMVTQQQQTSTDQVTQNVRAVADVVRQSAAATTQTRASAEGLKRQADRLTRLVGRFNLA